MLTNKIKNKNLLKKLKKKIAHYFIYLFINMIVFPTYTVCPKIIILYHRFKTLISFWCIQFKVGEKPILVPTFSRDSHFDP